MARQPIQAEYTTFVKGLITEASPFTYPENASLEEVNFVLNQDGSRSRRFGMDYEEVYSLINTGVDVTSTGAVISSQTWSAVSNIGTLEFAVVQVGNDLYFFHTNRGTISGSPANQGNKITIGGAVTDLISGTSLYGNFIVVHGTQEVYILTYNVATDVVSLTTKRLEIRDLFGVYDGLAIDNRPDTLSIPHRYNLRNQGWPTSIRASTNENGGDVTSVDPVEYTKTVIGVYPSNADIVWMSKLAGATEVKALNSFYPVELRKVSFGNTQAPMGRYIIDLFNRGDSRATTFGTVLIGQKDQSFGGIVAVAAFAGRVFYAVRETAKVENDVRSPNIGTMVFYSRSTDNIDDLTKCYTEADPTSEHIFDPIATDGGFITIPDSGEMINLINMGQSLFVFCTNGVWEVHGGEESFSATNQSVSKTTDIGAASYRAIVYAEDKIAYWGLSGIYLISRNDLTLRGGNNDLTYATIQTLYDNIDSAAKESAVGTYDPFIRTFRWMYRDITLPNKSFFNKELVYDVNLGAFYIFDISVPNYDYPLLCGYLSMKTVLRSVVFNPIVVGTDNVQAVADDVVIQDTETSGEYRGAIKYLTLVKVAGTHRFTFSHYKNTKFRDWYTHNGVGVDAAARMLTGYTTGGSSLIDKAIDYLHVYMKRTELGLDTNGNVIDPSSCTLQVQWDWTNSIDAGRWTRPFEAYRLPRVYSVQAPYLFDYSYLTVTTKNKIRGHGRALSILFQTKPDHNCILYGWGIDGSASKD